MESPRANLKDCNIIMKGGITSGVVYPSVISELAKTYRFRRIGGTSAGAIAAAATAAAEYGETNGGKGFKELETLPAFLGSSDKNGQTKLRNLFQPQQETKAIFDFLFAFIQTKTPAPFAAFRVLRKNFLAQMLLGSLPGLLLIVLTFGATTGFTRWWSLVSGLLLTVIGASLVTLWGLYRKTSKALPDNGLGLCSGTGDEGALINWLSEYLDELAGVKDKPLTFGDLWGTSNPKAERQIDLQMMTTNLTLGQPHRLPFDTKIFYFDPVELGRFFPPKVINWMVRHPRHDKSYGAGQFVPMPEPANLPVIVATRLSLSFPLLFSAVPLYAIDFSRKDNKDRRPERCYFTDGGISSNFPVHFFDKLLPDHPTFLINLKPHHPDYGPDSEDFPKSQGVRLVTRNSSGTLASWNRFDDQEGFVKVIGYVHAMIETGFNWQDTLLTRVPGFRDRIAHVGLDASREGGLNLDMDSTLIEVLTKRGAIAGERLGERFKVPVDPANELSWDNHRWARYRSTMALIEDLLLDFHDAYTDGKYGGMSFKELLARDETTPPTSYRLTKNQKEHAEVLTESLIALAEKIQKTHKPSRLGHKTPDRHPVLRVMPDL